MDKREIILDAMREFFKEGRAGTASVSDIARKAGIAKGGMYYYFRSKEEAMDALVLREYEDIIRDCEAKVSQSTGNALEKLELLLKSYRGAYVDASIDEYLHMPQNAALHQKSLAQIVLSLSPIIAHIIGQGIEEHMFSCSYQQEYSDIIMSVFAFLLDPGIFLWTGEQYAARLKALANMLEAGLGAPQGSLCFLFD